MGNSTSANSKNSKLADEIDRIASNYILQQNFNDINKLSEKDHCDKLVILTAKIIGQNLNALEQKEMVNRISKGREAVNREAVGREAEEGRETVGREATRENEVVEKEPESLDEEGNPLKKKGAQPLEEEGKPLKKKGAQPLEEEEGVEKKKKRAEPLEEEDEDEDEEDLRKKKQRGGGEDASEAQGVVGAQPLKKQRGGEDTTQDGPLDAVGVEGGEPPCIIIAKFYVKIAHVFAAIMKTINPVIIANDKNGKPQKYNLISRVNKPSDSEIKHIEHNNFCTKRMNNLIQESDYNRRNPGNTLLNLKARFCNMNYDTKTKKTRKFYQEEKSSYLGGRNSSEEDANEVGANEVGANEVGANEVGANEERGRDRERDREGERDRDGEGEGERANAVGPNAVGPNAVGANAVGPNAVGANAVGPNAGDEHSEIGIPELLKLYYDVYDPDVGEFTSMSDDMKIIYEQDVAVFYETFTGKPVPTDENGQTLIKRFDEIPLREYHKNDKCKPEGMFTQTYEGSLKDEKLFQKYAIHMTKMMNTMNKNQDKLLAILKKLFIFPKGIEKKKKEKKKEEIKKEEESKAPETQGNLALPNMQAPAVEAPAGADKTAVEAPAGAQAPAGADKTAAQAPAGADKTAVEAPAAQAPAGAQAPAAQAPAGAQAPAAPGADVVAPADKPAGEQAQAPAADVAPAQDVAASGADVEASAVKVETKVGGEGEAGPAEASAVEVKEVNPAEVKPAEVKEIVEVKESEVKEIAKPAEVKESEVKESEAKSSEAKSSEVKESEAKPEEIDETAVIINPNLDDELLQSLINTTRKLIVELYITCEKDFLEGISIFESIVAVQLAKTTGSQIKLLNDMTMEYLAHTTFEKG